VEESLNGLRKNSLIRKESRIRITFEAGKFSDEKKLRANGGA
jgi:hypothetical protein